MIKDMQLVTIEGGPHAIALTHADQVNRALLEFLDYHPVRRNEPNVSRDEFVTRFLMTVDTPNVRLPANLRSYLLEEVIKPDAEWAEGPKQPSVDLDQAASILREAFNRAIDQATSIGSNGVSPELLNEVLHEVIEIRWHCPWPFYFC